MRAEFARVIEPLELSARRRLGNPQRQSCLEAFAKFPSGVRQVIDGVLADATRNPLGLFVYRIKNGWHELEPLPESRTELTARDHSQPRPGESPEEYADRVVGSMK